jgi:hypothetical protein
MDVACGKNCQFLGQFLIERKKKRKKEMREKAVGSSKYVHENSAQRLNKENRKMANEKQRRNRFCD